MPIVSSRVSRIDEIEKFYKEVDAKPQETTIADFVKQTAKKFDITEQNARTYVYKIRKRLGAKG
ncbi:hypothetical protein KEU06_08215 [Pseudaminobacter sp. 19-2017]|uniref:Uncharacterized protein n=2 Tax=Pseudaminobacter soli (ex Zhang et al. 2022) TaxID=2831468 RepID=A0A942E517_9HYPH|nr:hypothetical protein [Pseudaminobacter soli]